MNKKNFIKGTALPVALFFSMVTLAPVLGFQPASAAIDVVQQKGVIKGTVVDTQGEPVIGHVGPRLLRGDCRTWLYGGNQYQVLS